MHMDAYQFFLIRHREIHKYMIDGVVNQATEAQLRSTPIAGINTIAWLLWHMARAEDIGANRLVAHCPQLFLEEGWAKQLNVPRTDFGFGMTASEVSDLSARVNLDALRVYWAVVDQRTQYVVGSLTPENLDEDNDPEYIRQVVDEDGIASEAGMWRLWAEMPDRRKGYFLSYLVLTHNWAHFGEAQVTLSLLRMPALRIGAIGATMSSPSI